jgi:hypothetical protein
MLSKTTQIVLFVSSFSPLLIVFALLDSWGPGIPTIVCVVVAVASIVLLPIVLAGTRTVHAVPLRVRVGKRKDVEMLTYIATFLVPFITVEADSLRERVALGIFVALIALFYIKGDMYFWNPILGLRGYRAIEIEMQGDEVITLMTKRAFVRPGTELRAIQLSHHIYWEP